MDIRFDRETATDTARIDCQAYERVGDPFESLYWHLVVPVGLFASSGEDLFSIPTRGPGTVRIPLLKLATTLNHAIAIDTTERFELDFGGTLSATVTLQRLAEKRVSLENDVSGVRTELPLDEFQQAVRRFNGAVIETLSQSCPSLLAAALAKGWLRESATS